MKKKFLAFDTETINRAGGGYACLLIKGDDKNQEVNEFPKDFDEIFNFLKGYSYVCWNADFDIRAIIHMKFTNEQLINDLAEFDCGIYRNYAIEYIQGKYFKCKNYISNEYFEIWDIYQFFDCSLNEAASKYLGEQKIYIENTDYKNIDKLLRSNERDKIIKYAKKDVELTFKLFQVLNNSLEAVGLKTNDKYFSSGYFAMQYLKNYLKNQKISDELNEFFKQGYFGGLMDYRILGKFDNCYYYDIKSAYPYEIMNLYSLENYKVKNFKSLNDLENADYGCFYCKIEMPLSTDGGWIPKQISYQNRDLAIYPVGIFYQWIGLSSIRKMIEYGIKFEIIEGKIIYTNKQKFLKDKILEMYNERKDEKKSLIMKKILNSIYGKFAEQTDYSKELPERLKKYFPSRSKIKKFSQFNNFIFASYITENTRIKIWEAGQMAGGFYFATDGVFCKNQLPENIIGSNIGDYSYKGKFSGVILGIGKYIIQNENVTEAKFRGFKRQLDLINELRNCKYKIYKTKVFNAHSIKEYAKILNHSDFNVLQDFEKEIDLSQECKRIFKKEPESFQALFKNTYETEPYILEEII